MATITLVSTTLPSFVAECSRRLIQREALLTVPLNNASQDLSDALLTVNASFPTTYAVATANGDATFSVPNTTPADTVVLAGTPLADVTVSGLAEALWVAALRLDAAERSLSAEQTALNVGLGVAYSIIDGRASLNAIQPISYSVDTIANQVVTVKNYLV